MACERIYLINNWEIKSGTLISSWKRHNVSCGTQMRASSEPSRSRANSHRARRVEGASDRTAIAVADRTELKSATSNLLIIYQICVCVRCTR